MNRPPSGRAAAARRGACALLAAALLVRAAAAPEPSHAALRCPRRAGPGLPAHCEYTGGNNSTEYQYRVEGKQIWITLGGDYVNVDCKGFNVLESPDMPRVVFELLVTKVTLSGCPPPANSSLADTLAALNVTLLVGRDAQDKTLGIFKLTELPHAPPLTERHFLGLENLLILHVSAAVTNETVKPEPGFLKLLRSLEVLVMQDVILPPGELDDPPVHLQTLSLEYTGVEQLPKALLFSTNLQTLTVASNSALDAVAVPPGLLKLNLRSPATTLQLDAAPALVGLVVTNWVEEKPASLRQCGNLTSLQLTSPTMRVLPAGWLANCSRLQKLELQYAKNLTSLPTNLFTNASALTLLSFKQCALKTLPARFLEHVPRLRKLYLFGNQLQILPSDLFLEARNVTLLDLSSNRLARTAAAALAPLEDLTWLSLNNNPRLRDLCAAAGTSPFNKSTKLSYLYLQNTSINHICSDWRDNMTHLKILDLRGTNVSELRFEELQFKRVVKSKVLLGAALTAVKMTHQQFNAQNSRSKTSVEIHNNSKFKCDCNMYWTRRALDSPHMPLKYIQHKMRCIEGRALSDMSPGDMLCADDEAARECAAAGLPTACACGRRPDDEPAPGRVRLRVDCTGRGLDYIPLPRTHNRSAERVYELLMAHNRIDELRADALRPDIKKLDLSNNFIKAVKAEALARLGNFDGILHLAHNKLDCSCSVAPLLLVLRNRFSNLTDLEMATCEDGSALKSTTTENCLLQLPLNTWIACGVAAVLAVIVAIVALLASRERRFFIVAVLHSWGFSWCIADTEEDDGRRYDAFVTFSHKDEPIVLELIARLEPTYRLCVHYRDWIPGRYINEQVVESVQESRRTIALVSRHFLQSGWALAEFRQAHTAAMLEAKPRLVVVLLEDISTLELDEQLRRYLATKTYVRWGDSWFWDKLAVALPRPRPPAAVRCPIASSARPSTRDPLLSKREARA